MFNNAQEFLLHMYTTITVIYREIAENTLKIHGALNKK